MERVQREGNAKAKASTVVKQKSGLDDADNDGYFLLGTHQGVTNPKSKESEMLVRMLKLPLDVFTEVSI